MPRGRSRDELANGRAFMAAEVRHLARELEAMHALRWWLAREVLEDAVRSLSAAVQLQLDDVPQSAPVGSAPLKNAVSGRDPASTHSERSYVTP